MDEAPLTVVVGAGGVGKTTLAAGAALESAAAGHRTLVMTVDPSRRLEDALGVGEADGEEVVVDAVDVESGEGVELRASLLDARRTFDRLVERYAPSTAARDRILENRHYRHLAGNLAGVLEYMAVERLYEIWESGSYDRIVVDTPPTRQALDFLDAPARIVGFLDSGARRLATREWFGDDGHLRGVVGWGPVGRRLETWLDDTVGLELLREMSEFFRAFGPLYDGFRERAREVESLLASGETAFLLVAGPGPERNPDTLFFARQLRQRDYRLRAVVVNRVHPVGDDDRGPADGGELPVDGRRLLEWHGARQREGVAELEELLADQVELVTIPLAAEEPTGLDALAALGAKLPS